MGYVAGLIDLVSDINKTEANKINSSMQKALSQRSGAHAIYSLFVNGFINAGTECKEKGNCFFSDEETGCIVALDGEIYNALDDVEKSSQGDAERIGKWYRDYGEAFVGKLDGVFSFAIWDGKNRKLILARDRFGTKPLYVYRNNDIVLFASEIKALFSSGLYEPQVDLLSVDMFLTYGYIPAPKTMFKDIFQVLPATVVTLSHTEIREKQYWSYGEGIAKNNDPKDYPEQFEHLLKESIQKRVKRHPDAGCFLSGGLDTGIVVALRAEMQTKKFPVFTLGFHEKEYNEIPEAELVAHKYNLSHFSQQVSFEENFFDLLKKLVWHHDSPFTDTSAIPSYMVAALARECVDTVFTGDFPDQMLGGSGHYMLALENSRRMSICKKLLRDKTVSKFIRSIPSKSATKSIGDRFKRALYRETFPPEMQQILLNMPAPPLFKRALYSQDFRKLCAGHDPLEMAKNSFLECPKTDLLSRMLYFDMSYYAVDDLMVKVDRMSAAHGLCTISPFHDNALAEFAWQLPSSWKIRGNERKYILRRVAAEKLPQQILEKKKQGFAMPINSWLISKLGSEVESLLGSNHSLSRGLFDPVFIKQLLRRFLAGKTDYASGSEGLMIALITLELWYQTYFDNR